MGTEAPAGSRKSDYSMRVSMREWLSYETTIVRRAFRRTITHPFVSVLAVAMGATATAVATIALNYQRFTLGAVMEYAIPTLVGGMAGFAVFLVSMIVIEPARFAKYQSKRVDALEEQERDKPRPRIEATYTGDAVRFAVWNDGATGTFRATHQIVEARPPLQYAAHMQPVDVYWLRLSAVGRDSEVFADDHDDFEMSLELRGEGGPPTSFFAAYYRRYDVESGTMKPDGPPVSPDTPIAERWLDVAVTVTTHPPTPSLTRLFRVHHDGVEETTP